MPLGYSTSQTCPTVVFPTCLFELIYFVKSIFSPQKINDETWRKSRKPIIWDSTWVNPGGVHAVETCKKSDLGSKF